MAAVLIGSGLIAVFARVSGERPAVIVVDRAVQLAASEGLVSSAPPPRRVVLPPPQAAVPAAAPATAAAPDVDAGEHLTPIEEHARIVQAESAAREDLTNEIETYRRAAEESCWPDAPSAQGARLELTYGLTFDHDGNETSRAIQEEGQGVPAPVRDCLRSYEVPAFHLRTGSLARNVNVAVHYP